MIEIRKHSNITTSLYISDLGMKLPDDYSWVAISDYFSADQIESSKNLVEALKTGFIEMRVEGEYVEIPSWYLAMCAPAVRIPTELLDDDTYSAVQNIQSLRGAAHPVMWSIIQTGLLEAENQGQCRSDILNALMF